MDTIKTLENALAGPADPFSLFRLWLAEAEQNEPNDPNAMCLATTAPDGRPQARIVLLKGLDERGFVFYTNLQSRKGESLAANPYAALNFHWKSLGRAVRIEGPTERISDAEADQYFSSRPRGSRIGAWASEQSRPLASRSALQQAVEATESRYGSDEEIPRPPHWHGTRVVPERIEFWHDGAYRLHTRLVYQKSAKGWDRELLYP